MTDKDDERQPIMTATEANVYLDEVFPAVRGKYEILEISSMFARVRMKVGEGDIRPGGTVSGPSMFGAVDCSFYIALMGMIGKVPLAVTTNANISFLNKPALTDIIAEARILKLGKLLATGDVTLYSEGETRPVAHATATYAIPPK